MDGTQQGKDSVSWISKYEIRESSSLILLCSFKVHKNHLPKKKGANTAVRIASLGHALHVWLNGEYLGKNCARNILKV